MSKSLKSARLRTLAGFTIIDRRFGGKLREIITELNEYLYEDGGGAA